MQIIHLTPTDNTLVGKYLENEHVLEVVCDTQTAPFTVVLPDLTTCIDKEITISNLPLSGDGNILTVIPVTGQMINVDLFTITLDPDQGTSIVSDKQKRWLTQWSKNIVTTGNVVIDSDTSQLILGEERNASIIYDGTNLIINPKVVGSGITKTATGIHLSGTVNNINNGLLFGDGDTAIYELSDDTIAFWLKGSVRLRLIDTAGLYLGWTAAFPRIALHNGQTIPNLCPTSGDGDTGIGKGPSDDLKFYAGGQVWWLIETANIANMHARGDNFTLTFGAADDAGIYYDGSNMIFDSQLVGSGDFKFNNGNVFINAIKSGATQGAAGAAASELWKTASHATLPDNVVMIGV